MQSVQTVPPRNGHVVNEPSIYYFCLNPCLNCFMKLTVAVVVLELSIFTTLDYLMLIHVAVTTSLDFQIEATSSHEMAMKSSF